MTRRLVKALIYLTISVSKSFARNEWLAGYSSAAGCDAWLRLALAVANHFGALPLWY
jgi:hypothetical protein